MEKKSILIGVLLLVLGLLLYLYFFLLSPTFVSKPFLEKPASGLNNSLSEEQVMWLFNEMGAYKLHSIPFSSEEPIMEMVVDGNYVYTITLKGNLPEVTEGINKEADLRIYISSKDFAELISSPNPLEKIGQMAKENRVSMDILKDTKTLALKGYKSIYDTLNK